MDELMKGDFLDASASDDEELSEEDAAAGEDDDLDDVSNPIVCLVLHMGFMVVDSPSTLFAATNQVPSWG